MKAFILFIVTTLITSNYIHSQPGTLDQTFNDSGKVIYNGFGIVNATAIQPDGKILIGGETVLKEDLSLTGDTVDAFVIVRYMPDGTLDESFGNNGFVKTVWHKTAGDLNSAEGIHRLVVLKNGKILAAGEGGGFGIYYPSPVLAQYLSDGRLDSSFGDNGLGGISMERVNGMTGRAMEVMNDGRIIQAGGNGLQKTTIVRYLPDGSLDPSFGVNGISTVALSGADNINSVVIQPDNKIVAAGSYFNGSTSSTNFLIARFKENGRLDSSFGNNGRRIIDYNGSIDVLYSLALQPDGKILSAGQVAPAGISTSDIAIVRFKSNGFYDSSFGTNGIALAHFDEYNSGAASMALQPDGKITACGFARPMPGENRRQMFSLVQFNNNGNLNTSFGDEGKTTTDFGSFQYATSLSLQTDGKIIVAGNAHPGDDSEPYYNLALARYNNGTQNKVIAHIKKWIEHHILHWQNMETANTAYYTIEHSYNATSAFTQIAKVQTSLASGIYNYALPATASNSSQTKDYYRINAVSDSGSIIASSVLSDEASNEQTPTVSVYPNPARDAIHISGLKLNTKYEVMITNEKGGVVARATINKISSYVYNVQNLSKGVYYLLLTSLNKRLQTIKFMKE